MFKRNFNEILRNIIKNNDYNKNIEKTFSLLYEKIYVLKRL